MNFRNLFSRKKSDSGIPQAGTGMTEASQYAKPVPKDIRPPSMPTVDYIFTPLRTALLPTPAELRHALNYIKSDPRPILDVLRKLPQAIPHLIGLIGKRHDAMLSLYYEVVPHKVNAEDKEEQRRADEITNQLYKSNFDDQLKMDVNSNLFGHAVAIPHFILDSRNMYYANFEMIDFVHFTKKDNKLKLIVDKDDKDFWLTVGSDPRLTGNADVNGTHRAISGKDRINFLDLDYNALIVSSTNPFMGLEKDYLGGWMRPMLYLGLLLHYDVLDWAKFNELHGMPFRIGKYESYSSDDAVRVLKDAVRNLGTDASAVIDKSTEIEFKEAQKDSGDGYNKFAQYIESKMSVNLRGETLTTEVTSSGGNRALGQVHQAVGMDKLLTDIRVAESVVRKQIVERLYKLNFGENPKNGFYPEFYIYPKGIKSYTEMASVIRELKAAGLPMSKNRLYEEFNEFIEAPQDDNDKLEDTSPFNLM